MIGEQKQTSIIRKLSSNEVRTLTVRPVTYRRL